MAKVLSKEINTSEAVQKVLSGDKPGGFNKPGKSQAASSSSRSPTKRQSNRSVLDTQSQWQSCLINSYWSNDIVTHLYKILLSILENLKPTKKMCGKMTEETIVDDQV